MRAVVVIQGKGARGEEGSGTEFQQYQPLSTRNGLRRVSAHRDSKIGKRKRGLGRWPNQKRAFHISLGFDPQYPCKKLGMAVCEPVTQLNVMGAERGRLLATSLAPDGTQDPIS